MSFQAYLDNIEAKTGKTPNDFIDLAKAKDFEGANVKTMEVVAWLKEDFDLGHGHAMAMAHVIKNGAKISDTHVGSGTAHNDESNTLILDGKKNKQNMRYVALLRGINVGGKNKVSMTELRAAFETAGFKNVVTYINSGNVLFDSNQTDTAQLVRVCEELIEKTSGFQIVCSVISALDLQSALENAPTWWGVDNGAKHNAIFVIAPHTSKEVMNEVGEAKAEYEKVFAYGPIIFWTAPLETFGRTRYKNIVGTSAYRYVTIRNSNTAKKLLELAFNEAAQISTILR